MPSYVCITNVAVWMTRFTVLHSLDTKSDHVRSKTTTWWSGWTDHIQYTRAAYMALARHSTWSTWKHTLTYESVHGDRARSKAHGVYTGIDRVTVGVDDLFAVSYILRGFPPHSSPQTAEWVCCLLLRRRTSARALCVRDLSSTLHHVMLQQTVNAWGGGLRRQSRASSETWRNKFQLLWAQSIL